MYLFIYRSSTDGNVTSVYRMLFTDMYLLQQLQGGRMLFTREYQYKYLSAWRYLCPMVLKKFSSRESVCAVIYMLLSLQRVFA